jgi:glycosyltransferase involved in cell wall biosynthesis
VSDPPALSVLIPWCDRDELQLTLAANAPALGAFGAEILVINCGGDRERLHRLIAAAEATPVRQLDISAPRFNKAMALNVGLAHSRSDTIFVLDADVALLGDILAEAKAITENRSFVTMQWVYESEPATPLAMRQSGLANNFSSLTNNFVASLVNSHNLELHFRDGTVLNHQLTRQDALGNKRAGPGLLFAAKRDLLEIQGFNSELQGWGWEDDDVLVRLQHVSGLRRVQKGEALHLTHGDDRRALRGPRHQSDQVNFMKCCRNYNNGIFTGSYSADIAYAASRLAETPAELPAARQLIRCTQAEEPSFLSAPEYCGDEDGVRRESEQQRKGPPASIEELLLEAELRKFPLRDCAVLHAGIASSGLASRLSPLCRHITLVTTKEAGHLNLPNCRTVVCNKYGRTFREHLPLDAYDVIVDGRIMSDPCCLYHLKALLENYSSLLAPAGRLITIKQGPGLQLSEIDFACLANGFGFDMTKSGCGVYTLKLRASSVTPVHSQC